MHGWEKNSRACREKLDRTAVSGLGLELMGIGAKGGIWVPTQILVP
jgi:hypothetical protein